VQSCTLTDHRLIGYRVSFGGRDLHGDLTGKLFAFTGRERSLDLVELFAREEVSRFLSVENVQLSLPFDPKFLPYTVLFCEALWGLRGRKFSAPLGLLRLLPVAEAPVLIIRPQDTAPVSSVSYQFPPFGDYQQSHAGA